MAIESYTKEIENLFVQFLYTDAEAFVRVKNIMKPAFFDDVQNRKVVDFLIEYTNEHTSLPTDEQMQAVTGKTIEKIDDINPEHVDWFMDEFETFCQRKAAMQAVYDGMDLIKEDNLGELLERVKKAAELGIVKDLGIDYFESPADRLKKMRDNSKMVSSCLLYTSPSPRD